MRWLSLSLVAVVLVATIGLGWVFDVVYQQTIADDANETGNEIQHAEIITKQLASSLAQSNDFNQLVQNWPQQEGYQLRIIALKELVLPASLLKALQAGQPLNLESDADISIHSLIPGTEDVLILQLPVASQPEQQAPNRYWFTSLFYLLLILLFLLWARPLITRLLELRKSARAFGKGQLSERISVGKVSYISDLEAEFNHMAQRIEDLVSDVKLLSSAVSHDLRTPLARIRMGLDTLSEETDPVKRQQYEERINDHIDDMVELIETLLSYARLDQAMLQLEKREVNIKAMLEQLIRKKAAKASIQFICTPEQSNFNIVGDVTYLKMLFSNLIQNALQHSESLVLVSLSAQQSQIIVTVADDGPGVPQELQADLFKPFVRSRNSKYKGHGVGLAICKRVTDWHQGHIQVTQSAKLQGAEFVVSLPAN